MKLTKTTAPIHRKPDKISSTLTMSEEYDIKHFGKILDQDCIRLMCYAQISKTER